MTKILDDHPSLQAFGRVKKAIEEIQKGKMVVMVDDEDRENEGDLVYAACLSSPEKVNFMASHAKGLICVALTQESAQNLQLAPMVSHNSSSHETAFTVSVDAKEATTGISAHERDMTIKHLANPHSLPTDFVRPGHIFPLIAKEGGVLTRIGHTEGSVDLCRLAGLPSCAVICEIMKEDGSMARRPDLDLFCDRHDLHIVYISDLVEYRMIHESLIRCESPLEVNFMGAKSQKYLFSDSLKREHTVYQFGDVRETSPVKFHTILPDNELLGDFQKYTALIQSIEYLKEHGGILIFMDSALATMSDMREYGIGAQIIKYFGIKRIELLSNGHSKNFRGIHGFDLEIALQIPLELNEEAHLDDH
jgi:3,4-dihydroxy 2-butanone 4-phosphate synthase/GTP cyclohydrolase II